MTRYLYSICLLVLWMGLPAHAVVGPHAPLEPDPTPKPRKNTASCAHTRDSSHKTEKTVATTSKGVPTASLATSTSSSKSSHTPKSPASPAKTSEPIAHASPACPKGPHSSEPVATSARASSLGSTTRIASASRASSGSSERCESGGRLARVTAYWSGEGDYYTGRGMSATGVRLHDGHCAVDPSVIPYGSVVEIEGVGKYLAVDTGSAVISREAAREAAHNSAERNALVIDLYFESRRDGENFAATGPKYAAISWTPPNSNSTHARQARGLFADEDWSRIQSKQL